MPEGARAVSPGGEDRGEVQNAFRLMFADYPHSATLWAAAGEDFILTDYNRATVDLTKGGIREVLGASAGELFPDLPEIVEAFRRAVEDRTRVSAQVRRRLVTTEEKRDMLGHALPVAPNAVVLVSEDVTGTAAARRALAESEERYRDLVDRLPSAVAVVVDDRIVLANQKAAELYGAASPEELVGFDPVDLHPAEQRDASARRRNMVVEEGRTAPPHEYEFRRPDGGRVFLEVTAHPYFYGGKPAGMIAAQDVTQRVVAQRALAQSEALLRAITETTTTGIYVVRGEELLYVNRAGLEIAGLDADDPDERRRNRNPFEFVHPEMREMVRQRNLDRLQGRETAERYDVKIRTADGREKWIDFTARRIEYQGEGAVLASCTDVTQARLVMEELEASRGRLRALTAELAAVEERERRSIARDLHDVVGQNLALTVSRLKSLAESRPDNWERTVRRIAGQLEQTIADARSLTFEISPPILYDLGLEAALEWLVEKFADDHGLKVDFAPGRQSVALEDNLRYFIFRAARELLTNAVKHSGAGRVQVRLTGRDGFVDLEVEDDGEGFPQENEVRPNGGIGLWSLRERLESHGGAMTVHSRPGRGSRIRLAAPAGPAVIKGEEDDAH